MTLLVAALLFGVSGVAGVTVVTLSALSYAKHLDGLDVPTEDERCPALKVLVGVGPNNKGEKYPYRCELARDHLGPHRVKDGRAQGDKNQPLKDDTEKLL